MSEDDYTFLDPSFISITEGKKFNLSDVRMPDIGTIGRVQPLTSGFDV